MIALYFLLLAAPPAQPVVPAAPASAPAAAPGTGGIRQVGPGRYRVDAAALGGIDWARSARVVPHQQDGALRGFKLYGVRRSSPLAALGFRNGDLVVAIAGQPLRGMDEALALYEKVKNARSVEVQLERRGLPMTLVIELEGDGGLAAAFAPPAPPPELDVGGQVDGKLDFSLGEGTGGEGRLKLAIVGGTLKIPGVEAPVQLGRLAAEVALKADDDGLRGTVESLRSEGGEVTVELDRGDLRLPWTGRRGAVDVSLEVVVKFDPDTSPLRLLPGAMAGSLPLKCRGPVPAIRCRPARQP